MNFDRYIAVDEELEKKAFKFIDEVKNLQDMENELKLFRSTVRKITTRALGKLYRALKQTNPGMSPCEIILALITYLKNAGDGSFEEVAKIVVREMEPAIKKEFLEDCEEKYPNVDFTKLG